MSAKAARPFPLVPRRRFLGVQFGRRRTSRRGDGDEIAGTRPYQPGDLTAHIHWAASARLSEARGTDEFVVREFFAEQAPRVALVVDRRPGMAIHPSPTPWLDKRRAAEAAERLIAASAIAERGELALSDGVTRSPTWVRGRRPVARSARPARDGAPTRATPARCAARSTVLVRDARALPSGSFVFVVSDFLEPVPTRVWARLRALRWDVTPVVVQDPVWEPSFPDGRRRCRAARRPGDGSRRGRLVLAAWGPRARCGQRGASGDACWSSSAASVSIRCSSTQPSPRTSPSGFTAGPSAGAARGGRTPEDRRARSVRGARRRSLGCGRERGGARHRRPAGRRTRRPVPLRGRGARAFGLDGLRGAGAFRRRGAAQALRSPTEARSCASSSS